jgi:uncharacterized protein (TIGR02246 family)
MFAYTLVLVASVLQAQAAPAASPDAPFVALARQWEDAWNRHDMDALADVVAEDVDFLTVGGHLQKGRQEFKKNHAETHAHQLRKSTFEVRATRVQRLTPDVVLMHVEWTIRGDMNRDGTPRPPSRDGIFTWILTQARGRWRVRASQNTSIAPPAAPAK